MTGRNSWTLNKALVFGLIGGFAFLLLEIRYEHRSVLLEQRAAWIPILYSGAALIIGGVALYRWDGVGRKFLAALFAASVVVGLLGVWFHTAGHPLQALSFVGVALRLLVSSAAQASDAPDRFAGAPPLLAPLAFCGLGAFGLLACLYRVPAKSG